MNFNFILKLIRHKSHAKNAENAKPEKRNSCGLCALFGELA